MPETKTKPAPAAHATALQQFLDFGGKEALSCIFPVSIFIILAATQVVHIPGLPRYDCILIMCLLVQVAMYATKLETFDEIKVISVFHVFGLMLEIFKVHHGCWAYPEHAYSKVFDVPLYSGFLYASVASYICQAWRRLDLHLMNWPRRRSQANLLASTIYINFFSEHFLPDLRVILMPLVAVLFWKTWIGFTVAGVKRKMPLTLGFVLTGFFIWIAENISTLLHGYQYPNQQVGWNIVHTSKITSWFLLVIISFICVAYLKHFKAVLQRAEDPVETN
jgi:uncharacterized membrane protein YoaT (DUF817 family)